MRSVRSDLTQFGFGGESGSGGLVTRIEALEDNVEILENDIDKAFLQMNYSTQEHVVGEWIDGRTRYSKEYQFTLGSGTDQKRYDTEVEGIDIVTLISGTCKFASGNYGTFPYNYVAGTNSSMNIIFDATNNQFVIDTFGVDRNGIVVNLIFEYVKNRIGGNKNETNTDC